MEDMKTLILLLLALLLTGCAHNVCAPMMASRLHGCPYKGGIHPMCCSTNQTQEQCEENAGRFAKQEPLQSQGCR